jgi:hypothetical protein
LSEALLDGLLDALGLLCAESADDSNMRASFLKLVKDSQERFVVPNEKEFVELDLAEGDRICCKRSVAYDIIFWGVDVPLGSRRTH